MQVGERLEVPSGFYDALPLHKDRLSIRLLRIAPGKPKDRIRCKLKVVTVTAVTNYYALSYVWGNAAERRGIEVNGQLFPVTVNLEQALRAVRQETKWRVLWADAICINQADLEERAAQVREMGSIYKCAYQVLIWLGQGSVYASAALAYIKAQKEQNFAHSMEYFAETYGNLGHKDGLNELLCVPWWRRIWVIQELALSSTDPLLGCGREWIQWSTFEEYCRTIPRTLQVTDRQMMTGDERGRQMMTRKEREMEMMTRKVREMQLMRAEVKSPPRLRDFNAVGVVDDDLIRWIRRTVMFDATDPRDKIFALLGLARSRLWQNIEVNYKKSVSDLTRSLFCHISGERMNLDILVLGNALKSQGMPSWLPNLDAERIPLFRRGVVEFSTQLSYEEEEDDDCNARRRLSGEKGSSELGNPNRCPGCGRGSHESSALQQMWLQVLDRMKSRRSADPRASLCSINGQKLSFKGIQIGKITKIVDDVALLSDCTAEIVSLSDFSDLSLRKLAEKAFQADRNRRQSAGGGEGYGPMWPVKLESITRFYLFYWQSVWTMLFATPDDAERDMSYHPITESLSLEDPGKGTNAMRGRCQFMTDTGLLGLGPSDLAEGDEVVLLYASTFAFALRPKDECHVLLGAVAVSPPQICFPYWLNLSMLVQDQRDTFGSGLSHWESQKADDICREKSLDEAQTKDFILI